MRRVLAHGDVIKDAANVALPNPPAAKSYGPFPVPHATALRVMVAPTGGDVTVTLTWAMDGVSNTSSGTSTLTFAAGTAVSQLATCLGHLVTLDLVGSVNGVQADVWAVTANPLASRAAVYPDLDLRQSYAPAPAAIPTAVRTLIPFGGHYNYAITQPPVFDYDGAGSDTAVANYIYAFSLNVQWAAFAGVRQIQVEVPGQGAAAPAIYGAGGAATPDDDFQVVGGIVQVVTAAVPFAFACYAFQTSGVNRNLLDATVSIVRLSSSPFV